jgi:tryptophan synthase alpha chain
MNSVSNGFIYMVACYWFAIWIWQRPRSVFQTDFRMNLNNPQVIGFGINNKETFNQATQFAKGAIIGSFHQYLTENGTEKIAEFVKTIR